MPIKFHCEHCGKLVSAPDSAGGKMGKCPYCQQRCYIASPREQLEEIPIEPIDPEEERRRRKLMNETHQLREKLLEENEIAGEAAGSPGAAETPPAAAGSNLDQLIVQYLIHMMHGELPAATALANQIVRHGDAADEAIERLAMETILHPELVNVPPNVIAGFFRKLRQLIQT